jgi:DNA-binding XRE family transcriptional regulator
MKESAKTPPEPHLVAERTPADATTAARGAFRAVRLAATFETTTEDIDKRLGRRLRSRRRLLGLTQLQVAEAVGVRFQQIHKYELATNKISAARLWALARALDVPIGYFFEGVDERWGKAAA